MPYTRNVFVYGTLRPGHGHYTWAKFGVIATVKGCSTDGRLYHVREAPYPIYPVAKFDEDGTIYGDILVFDTTRAEYAEVCDMERNAGYEPRIIPVTTPEGLVQAEAWHYVYTPRGPQIESGDWNEFSYTET